MPKDIRVTEGVQISENILVLGGIRVAEGIRVPEGVRIPENIRVPVHLRVPEIFGYSTEKNWNYPTQPEKMFYPHTSNNNYNISDVLAIATIVHSKKGLVKSTTDIQLSIISSH